MDYNIPIELEIRLKINDFDDKDIGDKIFKPKHVDEKLGDKIYLTDKYELLPENLEKAGFKNDEGEHRSLLSSKTKMRQFLVSMQTGDRDAKGARYAKESIKEQDKKIEETEDEIINNDISLSTIERQEEIKVKLLELDKATKEQEEEEKREAKESLEDYKKNNSVLFEDYLQIKKGETELLKTIPPNLKPYYKNKVNEYFKSIDKDYD